MIKEQLSNFEDVGVFMHSFGQDVKTKPELPSEEVQKLRYELIKEELSELQDGILHEDIVEIADALTDLLYVVYGAGHAYGIDLDKCFNEVHRSNMSKLGADGKPIYREDGKILKGPAYFSPDLESIIKGNVIDE
jgi:predicted HAD superfamily Cof-like phosphohydrolase